MESNAWVESYLDALLSTGLSKEYAAKPADDTTNADKDVYAKYYVSQIMSTDEQGVAAAWRKSVAGGINDAKDVRLEYLSWRVWAMQQMRRRQQGRVEQPDDEALTGPLEDFHRRFVTDSESGPFDQQDEGPSFADAQAGPPHLPVESVAGEDSFPADKLPNLRILPSKPSANDLLSSPSDATPTAAVETIFAGRVDKLYIVLISMHGLIRGDKMELGKDADTGGQVKYVVELAKNLAQHPMVHRVDLMTRLIKDPRVDASYGEESEVLLKGAGKMGGAYIVRMAAGNSEEYIPKEELWPHVREFSDNALLHIKTITREMAQEGEPCELYAVHGHYADGGEAASLVAHTLDVEMVLTGHSLGRNKLDHLLKSGTVTRKQIEETYKISRRIEGEERALDAAIMVLSSTQVEIDDQWGLYHGFDPDVAKALRNRKAPGRHMARMIVIPPGLEFSSYRVELPSDPMQLYVDYKEKLLGKERTMFSHVSEVEDARAPANLADLDAIASPKGSKGSTSSLAQLDRTTSRPTLPGYNAGIESKPSDPPIWQQVHRFLRNPGKPVVLAMSRPDAKKNIATLVKAFGTNKVLRDIANLVLIMGNRDNIDSLNKGSQQVLQEVLKLIDAYDLYGSVAYPKAHTQKDISDIYNLATKTHGVFTNIALQEPFGLTLIEAAVHGAPIVATTHGGPVDIIRTLKNGKLVEPTDVAAVGQQILDILKDSNTWEQYSKAGVANILAYSWPSHCIQYLEAIEGEKLRKHKARTGLRVQRDQRPMLNEGEADDTFSAEPLSAFSNPKISQSRKGVFMKQSIPEMGSCPVNGLPDFSSMDIAALMARSDVNSASAEIKDDVSTLMGSRKGLFSTINIAARDRMAFAVLDSAQDADVVVPALTAALKSQDEKVGLGVVSVLPFHEVLDIFAARDFDVKRLDFVVCNAGAYIMSIDSQGNWRSEEAWEAKVSQNWDKQFVLRTLSRMSLTTGGATAQDTGLLNVLKSATAVDSDDGNGPLHSMLNFSTENSRMAAIDHATFMNYVRKRVRSRGIRCNLMLQLAPDGNGGNVSILHATPLRASRSLALRHLALLHGLNMRDSTYLCTPASVEEVGKETVLGALCSDLDTLVQGSQKVLVVPPTQAVDEGLQAGKNAAAYERLKVNMTPFKAQERVQILDGTSDIKAL